MKNLTYKIIFFFAFVFFGLATGLKSQNFSICYGDSTLLILNPHNGTLQWQESPDKINWFNVTGAINDSLMVRNQTNTTYYRALVNNGSCNSIYSDTITVNVSNLVIDAGISTQICAGNTTQLGGVPTASGGMGPISYLWTPADSLNSNTIANPIAHPDSTTTYYLTVTDSIGCSAYDSVTITVNHACIPDSLTINEIDYDNIGTDNDEFVEIYNPSSSPINLSGIILVFVNGAAMTEYLRVDLSSIGVLQPQEFLVVASPTVIVDPLAKKILFTTASNSIQNGAPDGVAILNTNSGLIADALSYEGSITSAIINAQPTPYNFVEGTPLPLTAADSNVSIMSIARFPSGTDTNNASVDWAISNNPTPGSHNIP